MKQRLEGEGLKVNAPTLQGVAVLDFARSYVNTALAYRSEMASGRTTSKPYTA